LSLNISDNDIASLKALALKAGDEIMRIYASDISVTLKADATPVTEADAKAEAIILDGLKDLFANIPVVAEEEAAAGRLPDIGDLFFLVDPLDGTKEFVSKNGEFTVNIALIKDAFPVFGVIYAPALGELYWGFEGHGAYYSEVINGELGLKTSISVRPLASEGLTFIGSRSHGSTETEAYLKAFTVRDFIAAGSSLKFCRIARGQADVYPRMGRTMEWDTAAGDAILRAAGGRVETLDGQALSYGKRNQSNDTDFANPYFVAFGHSDIAISQ
jgi:3'(2'), 5'-bisphosphate nucleotidase